MYDGEDIFDIDGPAYVHHCTKCKKAVYYVIGKEQGINEAGDVENAEVAYAKHAQTCNGEITKVNLKELVEDPITMSRRASNVFINIAVASLNYFREKGWDYDVDEIGAARLGQYIREEFGFGNFGRGLATIIVCETMNEMTKRVNKLLPE